MKAKGNVLRSRDRLGVEDDDKDEEFDPRKRNGKDIELYTTGSAGFHEEDYYSPDEEESEYRD